MGVCQKNQVIYKESLPSMDTKNLERLIIRYLSKIISKKEWEELNSWFEESGDFNLFRDYLKINYTIDCIMSEFDKEKRKKSVLEKIKKDKMNDRRLRRFNYFKYAAAITVILGVSYAILTNNTTTIPDRDVVKIVESGSNKAILTLENGNEVALEKGKRYNNDKASSNGESLVYTSKTNDDSSEELTFNYLTVPRGGQFFLKLSDETKVWVNSDSRIKYPTNFFEGNTREVEVVYGEAYFEVSPSSENRGASFEVLTRKQKVNVLGTEFNVRAYKNEAEVITTLVGGKVVVEKKGAKRSLIPNQQSISKDNSNHIDIREVDASLMTSWVRGLFIFEEESLGEMVEDLSRWYDVEVFFMTEELKKIPFTGVLERTKSLNDLLKVIEVISDDAVKFEMKKNVLIVK